MSASKSIADIQREYFEEQSAQDPDPADFIADSAAGIAAAAAVATLAAVAGRRNYLSGFVASATNPAAAVSGEITVTGIGGVTLRFKFVEAAAAGGLLTVQFSTPIPANADNTAIVVTLPAIATGGATAVAAWGFRK